MRSAIVQWLEPYIVVEVDPIEFDGPAADELQARLEQHFMRPVVMVTPDWEADEGIRARGFPGPITLLASPDVVWRDLELPAEPEIPF
jgi:hypothetical protein